MYCLQQERFVPSLLPFLVMLPTYNLPQKKCNFNLRILPGASGFLTLTQGHVDFVIWAKVHRPTHFPKRHATSEKRGRAGLARRPVIPVFPVK